MEMLDLTLVLRYLSGEPLQEELQERKAFIQESVIPVMDMFLLEVRDKQVRRPVLYVDYLVTSTSPGTVRGDASKTSADWAFRTPAEDEMERIEGWVEALTLDPTIPAPGVQETVQAQHEGVAALAMGRSKAEKLKSENIQKILSLSGLSANNKLKMISHLTHQVTFSPTSYETLKDNVKDAFDDADAALHLLTDRLRSWPILKRNDYKQLANFTGFATNYVMQLMHFENGAAFNPRNVVSNLYGKFYPHMMGDYRREWAQEELMKGNRSDWDQVVWLLEWLKEKLKVAKAY